MHQSLSSHLPMNECSGYFHSLIFVSNTAIHIVGLVGIAFSVNFLYALKSYPEGRLFGDFIYFGGS